MKKYFKKISAVIVAMAMVLAMCTTAFAAETSTTDPYNATITVNNLLAAEDTTINVYKVIGYDSAANDWAIESWAAAYVNADTYEIDLTSITVDGVTAAETATVKAATWTSQPLPVGAYLIIANSDSVTYNKMVANTYTTEAGDYMGAQNVAVVAKGSGYNVGKEADDSFVGRGQTVTFTITTTVPYFAQIQEAAAEASYTIKDTPTGLDITELTSVTMDGAAVTVDQTAITETMNADGITTSEYVVDLSQLLEVGNTNAGKKLELIYKAVVMTDEGYANTANAFKDDAQVDVDPTPVTGYTGDITLTKKEVGTETVLNGAVFTVDRKAAADADETKETLTFIKESDGVYVLAKEGDTDTVKEIEATNGTVQIKGLGEGYYHFNEVKAPVGYSINEDGVGTTVEANATQNVTLTTDLFDTRLAALPSTGGVGTYAFTIVGVVVMAVMASMFFIKRRREAE